MSKNNNLSEKIEVVFENDKIRVERIYSYGQSSAVGFWYNNGIDEWVSVQRGNAKLQFEDKMLILSAGDSCYITANTKHRVDSTSTGCEWLCVYVK